MIKIPEVPTEVAPIGRETAEEWLRIAQSGTNNAGTALTNIQRAVLGHAAVENLGQLGEKPNDKAVRFLRDLDAKVSSELRALAEGR